MLNPLLSVKSSVLKGLSPGRDSRAGVEYVEGVKYAEWNWFTFASVPMILVCSLCHTYLCLSLKG